LSHEQRTVYEKEGRKPVVRFEVPEGNVEYRDLVQGDKRFGNENFADFIIQREDGTSPYNFAAVVDDHLMEITHVIRGEGHVTNTPKQILLYQAFGYATPEFAHIPLITGQDGKLLSKRHGATSIAEFKRAGYLPEALLNYLSLLSWSSETGDEVLSVERLIDEFTFDRISRSPARFDMVKLNWMNGVYIRALSPEERFRLAKPYLNDAGFIEGDSSRLLKIIEAVKDRVEQLSEIPKKAELFFAERVNISGEEERTLIRQEESKKIYDLLLQYLEEMEELTIPEFQAAMKKVQQETGLKGKHLWLPVRVALTGELHGPDLPIVLEILGKNRCIKLLESAQKM